VNLTKTDLSETRKKLTVELTGSEVSEAEDRIVAGFVREAKLPGFRPGKAPASHVRKRYAKEIHAELRRDITGQVVRHAVEESGLEVHRIIELDPVDPAPGQDLTVSVTADIVPPFELPAYKGLPAQKGSEDVSEAEVDAAVEQLRRARSDFNVVDRPAQPGDYVRVTYRGSIDGQPIADFESVKENPIWGTQENTWEEAGAEGDAAVGVPEVIAAVVGMAAGDRKEVEATFSDDHPVAELRGRQATYAIEVSEVRERVLPELNEEFFKSLQVEGPEAFRDRVEEDLRSRKSQENQERIRSQVMEALAGRVEFPVPESSLEDETQNVMRGIMEQNMQRGVPMEEFEKRKEELFAQSREIAARRVKMDILLNRIAEVEKIDASEEDFSRAIINEAVRNRTQPEQLAKELREDRERLQSLRRTIVINKTLDFLVNEATMEEGDGSTAEAERPGANA